MSTMHKNIYGTEIEVIRKKVKNINLSVLPPDGRVRISAPYSVSDERIEAFVRSKAEWIRKHQKLVIERAERNTADSKNGIRNGNGNMYANMTDTKRKALVEQYRKKLTPIIEHYMALWQARTGLYAAAWQLRDMKTRWGSCTPKSKKIRFSVWLAEKPPELIEYVVLHELLHLAVPNHGPDFKSLLTRYMPDRKERERRLNEKSR